MARMVVAITTVWCRKGYFSFLLAYTSDYDLQKAQSKTRNTTFHKNSFFPPSSYDSHFLNISIFPSMFCNSFTLQNIHCCPLLVSLWFPYLDIEIAKSIVGSNGICKC